jgi:hypothetical protein
MNWTLSSVCGRLYSFVCEGCGFLWVAELVGRFAVKYGMSYGFVTVVTISMTGVVGIPAYVVAIHRAVLGLPVPLS